MELIQTVFNQLENDIHQKLKTLEKQVVFILAANQKQQPQPEHSDDFMAIKRAMDTMTDRLSQMESRMRTLETTPAVVSPDITSAGLEGLLMKPMALPSPVLSARSENHVVHPRYQRQIVIEEQEEEEEEEQEEEQEEDEKVEPDEDAVRGEVAEEVGGIDEELVEQEEEEEGEEEEEVAEETIELEDFIWKGKTYYKTPDHNVYRGNDDGDVEDEPFAKYDPKTNTLKRI